MSALVADPATNCPPGWVPMAARGIRLHVSPQCGIVAGFVVEDQQRLISMMHKAPWVGSDLALPAGAPPHQAHLQGDFFCAPFSDASADAAPLHGWPANGGWQLSPGADGKTLKGRLDRRVMGASVAKELSVTDDHPFLYQRHGFTGGRGAIAVANHAMVSLPNGGHLRFSAKRWFETPANAPETDPSRGRSALRYPAKSTDPRQFPGTDGAMVDLTRYPFGPAHEDFVIGVEAAASPLGWTAVSRPMEGDLYLSLRNPRRLPMTMLWHSNGGRDYAPWLGRHRGCLGIEEGIALPLLDLTRNDDPDIFARSGQDSALNLIPDGKTEVRHITGCIAWPTGEPVRDIWLEDDGLVICGEQGARRTLPIHGDFLDL